MRMIEVMIMTMIIRMICFFNVLPPSKQLVSHIGIFPEFFVCLFDLILYVPSTIFHLYRDGSSWVEPVLS